MRTRRAMWVLGSAALLGAIGCGSGPTEGGDGPVIVGDGGTTPDQTTPPVGDGAATMDLTAIADLTGLDQAGLDLCAPLAVIIAHPDSGGCRVAGPVFFHALVSAGCADVTTSGFVSYSWTTTPSSALDGMMSNDVNPSMALGVYTISLTVTYMGQMASTSIPFSIKTMCP